MGAFTHRIAIAASPDGPFEELDALVDAGSTYTWVPRPVLERLSIQPTERREFETADERIIERDVAEVPVRLDNALHFSLVVFGDPNTTPLLGVVTLETFGLGVDPVRQRLVPVRGLAMPARQVTHPRATRGNARVLSTGGSKGAEPPWRGFKGPVLSLSKGCPPSLN